MKPETSLSKFYNTATDAGDAKQITLLGITALLLFQPQLLKINLNHYSPLKTMLQSK
jgi:anaerobic glycerol-3-phosphate dehydrogenase